MNPELKREIDPTWFQPQSNQNEYTKGYYKGRDYERKRILAILNDWPLNVQWDWADIFNLINENLDYRQLTMSPALLEDYKFNAAMVERERIFDGIKALFDRLAPAHAADGSQPQKAIEEEILAIVRPFNG